MELKKYKLGEIADFNKENIGSTDKFTVIGNHSIFRYDNFIGCFSADKIKMSVRK